MNPALPSTPLFDRRVLLIISGGIAAYKSLDLIRRLRERGADVRCILTSGGAEFITPLSVAALSENKVYSDLFSLTDEQEMGHIRLARDTDLVLVCPASANMIARFASGVADDLASTVLLATDKPIMIAPAMNPVMYANTATQNNLAKLKERGVMILSPAVGEMACGEHGEGRLADVMDITKSVVEYLGVFGPLSGKRALVTSGPTFESIDPVRFIGNHSSGKQGHAIAAALARLGADVTLITGPVHIPPPRGGKTIAVVSAQEMHDACHKNLPVDIAVCAAAVADFRPEKHSDSKIKKSGNDGLTLRLIQNPDILKSLCQSAQRPKLVIGFAAETDVNIQSAEEKLKRKGCDWLVLNDVQNGAVFGSDHNAFSLITRDHNGQITTENWGQDTKESLARRIADKITSSLARP